jgi:hypothetical protein
MTMNELQRLARAAGFSFLRMGKGQHQIWVNKQGQRVMLSPSNSRWKRVKFQADLRRANSHHCRPEQDSG